MDNLFVEQLRDFAYRLRYTGILFGKADYNAWLPEVGKWYLQINFGRYWVEITCSGKYWGKSYIT